MEPVNIGVVGLGTVGGGTVDVLHRNSAEISRRAGREIRVSRAAVRDLDRSRSCDTSGITLTNDPFEVANDPGVRVVVELIGGETTAFEIVIEALEQGKHVVTANKALIATRGNEIFRAAHERGLVVAFEAAVAGGISIIKILREGLAGNRVKQLVGIVNGTSNYILTGMHERGSDFEPMLREAQALGYAESDPTFDIDGVDAAHKLTILASIAYGIPLDFSAVYTEGIGTIQGKDVSYAEDLGYRIKHLGIARRRGNRVDLRVHPCLIPETHLLASVDGVMNAILVEGDAVGQTIHYGAGAGANPTASSVVADIVDVVRTLTADPGNRVPHLAFQPTALTSKDVTPLGDIECAYYLRLLALDRPGVLAEIARILGENNVSIEAIRQQGTKNNDGNVSVVIVTHKTREMSMTRAIGAIEALPAIAEPVMRIRLDTLEA